MSLRLRIVVALAVLASVATAMIGLATYRSTRQELLRTIDQSLDDAARRGPSGDGDDGRPGPGPGGRLRPLEAVLVQVLGSDGSATKLSTVDLPVDKADQHLAQSGTAGTRRRHSLEVDGEEFRVLTVATGNGAVQLARSMAETNNSLATIARRTVLAVFAVMLGAILLGWWIGRHITRRLHSLNVAARQVATTGDLDVPIPISGRDEVSQLGSSIRGMLAALATSRAAQHQLVQDAGHELRTPLTSLRTNVAVLRRFDALTDEDRRQILVDLDSETRELTELVNELVELATDRRNAEEPQLVELGAVAGRVAERARRRSGREIVVDVDDTRAEVHATAIERAIHNLVDNAIKFAPNGPIEISVRGGRVGVRDHGAGIDPADQDKVFDRFYRAVAGRSLPGSGLGLAIVRAAVEDDGGTVFAINPPGGGAEIGFTLPTPGTRLPM